MSEIVYIHQAIPFQSLKNFHSLKKRKGFGNISVFNRLVNKNFHKKADKVVIRLNGWQTYVNVKIDRKVIDK